MSCALLVVQNIHEKERQKTNFGDYFQVNYGNSLR